MDVSWIVKKAERQRIDTFELLDKILESLGLQGDPTSPSQIIELNLY